jgi:hypothetical protein
MDLRSILRDLYAEKKRLDKAIALLEEVHDSHSTQSPAASTDTTQTPPVRRRGRKSMGNAEREQVSKRMKAYWSKNKEGQGEHST